MNENMWKELKEHCKKQETRARELKIASGLIAHVWKDVQNKMWSLEHKK